MLNLNVEIKQSQDKAEVINKMLEENAVAFDRTNLKYSELLIQARRSEMEIKHKYNASDIVAKHKQAMLQEVNEIGKQTKEQFNEVFPDLWKIFNQSIVRHQQPRYSQMISSEYYAPSFSS